MEYFTNGDLLSGHETKSNIYKTLKSFGFHGLFLVSFEHDKVVYHKQTDRLDFEYFNEQYFLTKNVDDNYIEIIDKLKYSDGLNLHYDLNRQQTQFVIYDKNYNILIVKESYFNVQGFNYHINYDYFKILTKEEYRKIKIAKL